MAKRKEVTVRLRKAQRSSITAIMSQMQQLRERYGAMDAQLSLYILAVRDAVKSKIPETYTKWSAQKGGKVLVFTPEEEEEEKSKPPESCPDADKGV